MWNAVIALEGFKLELGTMEALVKIRHVAVDCMYMSTTVLGGISARYNIDELSLLKFYTACGQKYSTELGNMDMADVCFSKAAEFAEPASNESTVQDGDQSTLSQAMFDLLLGRAECSWEKGDCDQAERFVNEAHRYMAELPDKHEFLASVEYNFGLFTYQAKETERALKWLKKSMETRDSDANTAKDFQKQAKTARLAGVCLLALQDYEGSWNMMRSAEDMYHDPVGSYLLLKLSIITKKPNAVDLLIKTVEDSETTLDVSIACVSLFGDAQRVSDAAIGFERLFARFSCDSEAIAGTIGLRYFETLTALGKIDEALEVFDICCNAMTNLKIRPAGDSQNAKDLHSRTAHLLCSRWSALLLATGSTQADRKDFQSASRLLNRALVFAKTFSSNRNSDKVDVSSAIGNVVLENEAAICRLASSCALCAIDDLQRKTTLTPEKKLNRNRGDDDDDQLLGDLLKITLTHAERAKRLEPTDFAPRLLLFRAYLVIKEHQKAALELRQASLEIKYFDPGALAEAACAARDVGSKSAVVAALRCILNMDPATLSRNLVSTFSSPPKGFFGKILLACVHILLDNEKEEKNLSGTEGERARSSQDDEGQDEVNDDLLAILKSGLRGIEKLGLDLAFDEERDNIQECITYLTNVCWNKGREAGTKMNFAKWGGFFDTCYRLSQFLSISADSLQTQRMSKLMCASAAIENPASKDEDFQKARGEVTEARQVSRALQEVSPCEGEDPIEGLLLILEARCCIGCADLDSLAGVVQMALEKQSINAGVFEQLAAVCHNFTNENLSKNSETRVICTDLTAALLTKAVDLRLCDGSNNLSALAVTMREHLGVELSRGSTPGRAYVVFSKAVGVVLENQREFPTDEWRWLVAVGWDRAEMHHRLGQNAEARRWCQGVRQLAEGCTGLASYLPRLDAFLSKL